MICLHLLGLGKTCQVIAFLARLLERGIKGPHLVVVPSSTLGKPSPTFKHDQYLPQAGSSKTGGHILYWHSDTRRFIFLPHISLIPIFERFWLGTSSGSD